MFFEIEGPCTIDRVVNGDARLTWALESGDEFSLTMEAELFEGSHMHATWSLRWHHDDPDVPISCPIRVRQIKIDERFSVTLWESKTPLYLPTSETDAIAGFAAHFVEPCWLEMMELP